MNRPCHCFILVFLTGIMLGQEYIWPTDASRALSSNFGEFRSDHFHMGIDIKTNGQEGFPVYAIGNGYISRMVANYNGYGKALYFTTEDNHIALYAHLSRFIPTLEQVLQIQQEKQERYHIDQYFSATEFPIQKGTTIGYTGNTGASFAPHLHFEYRNNNNQPLNPLLNGFSLPDRISPSLLELAVIPITPGTLINANPLPQIFPLFRDNSGLYHFPDTLNCYGSIGLAVRAQDRRQGASNKYQIYRAELKVDDQLVHTVVYDLLDYSQSALVKITSDHRLSRLNLGDFQNLFLFRDYPGESIHKGPQDGVLNLTPGYHPIEIRVWDTENNSSVARGVIFSNPPAKMDIAEISRSDRDIGFAIQPIRGSIPVKSVTCYSFTPYGYADEKVEILSSKQEGKALHFTLPRKKADRRILQFIGINKMGAYSHPIHWAGAKSYGDILDADVDLKLSYLESGLILQVETAAFLNAEMFIRMRKSNGLSTSVNLMQVQPTVYLSQSIEPLLFQDLSRLDIIIDGSMEREIQHAFTPGLILPGKSATLLSNDRLCSVRIPVNSVFDTTLMWIDIVEHPVAVKSGKILSKGYQLQPFEMPLKDTIQVGIRYADNLAHEDNLGLYYFDGKENSWIYLPTINRRNRRVLTASVSSLEAVTIIQDNTAPIIKSTFPASGGYYHYQDVQVISASVEDDLSGIDSKEESLKMILDGKQLIIAYQPIKQELSCRLDVPLDEGTHELEILVKDQAGNSTSKKIKFSLN